MAREWRVEADDEWLATHRSDTLGRLRRRFAFLGGLAGAVSEAEMGPYGGAPRRPRLRIGGRTYAYVRYTTQHIAYTSIRVDPDRCRRCGQELVEAHRIGYAQGDTVRVPVGTVRVCRACQADSWSFHSRMPTTVRARWRARKVVL
jgi:hypothetical protein